MEIVFKSRKLEKSLTKDNELLKQYGERAGKIWQRMQELRAAENLSVMETLKATGFHALTGDRAGHLAVRISTNWRIIFAPAENPEPRLTDGSLDLMNVKRIMITSIEDYH